MFPNRPIGVRITKLLPGEGVVEQSVFRPGRKALAAMAFIVSPGYVVTQNQIAIGIG